MAENLDDLQLIYSCELGRVFSANRSPLQDNPPLIAPSFETGNSYADDLEKIISSWKDSFQYKEAGENSQGLRTAQIGAIHAIQGHWITSDEPATIVMPTGTGKTETMLSILVLIRCERLLVIVPNLALRTQIADKFQTLGLLKKNGVVKEEALLPIVGILEKRPDDVDQLVDFFSRCNVIVTNIQIAGECREALQEQMAKLCPYLFIDEAHHVEARTWHQLKSTFDETRIVQFTATPFRNDGKLVGGKIIYSYPLKKALNEGYFKPINWCIVKILCKEWWVDLTSK